MNPIEQALYFQVYAATIQGIHAHGKYYSRQYGAANYHPSTSEYASENPDEVGRIAAKQAHAAVAHHRALQESFTK